MLRNTFECYPSTSSHFFKKLKLRGSEALVSARICAKFGVSASGSGGQNIRIFHWGGSNANPDVKVFLGVDAPKQNKDRLWWRRYNYHLSPFCREKLDCDLKILFWWSSSSPNFNFNFNFNVNFELKLKLNFGDEDDHQNKILRSQSNFSRQHGDKC